MAGVAETSRIRINAGEKKQVPIKMIMDHGGVTVLVENDLGKDVEIEPAETPDCSHHTVVVKLSRLFRRNRNASLKGVPAY